MHDPNCVVILVENPPFSGSGSNTQTDSKENLWKDSYVCEQAKKEGELAGVISNNSANLFIWSAFKYYLTSTLDSYILYCPTNLWRNQGMLNKKLRDGFLCNRREFAAQPEKKKDMQPEAVMCVWWQNIDDTTTEALTLTPYDINGCRAVGDNGVAVGDITLRKAYKMLSEAYDKKPREGDKPDGIFCELNGSEFKGSKERIQVSTLYNVDMVGYICAQSFVIDRKMCSLVRSARYDGHGFFLRADNFIEKLPFFVAAALPYDRWYKAGVYSKSYDGGGSYSQDSNFLKKCLIYTGLSPKNKCRTLSNCSDGRFYRNELCFDGSDTLASVALQALGIPLTDKEKALFKAWTDVQTFARQADEYNQDQNFKYGFWQIKEEIDSIKKPTGRKNRKGEDILEPKYPFLKTAVRELDKLVKAYYTEKIIADLFKYELIK